MTSEVTISSILEAVQKPRNGENRVLPGTVKHKPTWEKQHPEPLQSLTTVLEHPIADTTWHRAEGGSED